MSTARNMKHLTLVPIGGLANRLFAITSAISFCRANGYTLKIYWFKDWGMGANFHDLFQKIDLPDVELIDAKWYHYIYDRPRKRNLWLPWIWQRFAFGNRIYEKESFRIRHRQELVDKLLRYDRNYLIEWYAFFKESNFGRYIRPLASIQSKVQKVQALFPEYTVGIHIRRSDHVDAIRNSPTQLFIDKMRAEILAHPAVKFFVASDSVEVKKELREEFKDRIISYEAEMTRGSKNGIIDAVVELTLLSKTARIYGSFNSTYSEFAAKLSDIDLIILQKGN